MSNKKQPINFLNVPWLKRFLKSFFFPRIFQWITVLVFAVIMFETLAGPTLAHDNFVYTPYPVLSIPALS